MLQVCGEASDEALADQVLTAMLAAGVRQHLSFLAHFNQNVTQFLGELKLAGVSSYSAVKYVPVCVRLSR